MKPALQIQPNQIFRHSSKNRFCANLGSSGSDAVEEWEIPMTTDMTSYHVAIDDLSDDGILVFLIATIGEVIDRLDNWTSFGPLITQHKIDVSFLSGDHAEPWSASIDRDEQNYMEWGSTPQRAIAKTLIASRMKGESLVVPHHRLTALLTDPDLAEPVE